MTKLIAAAALAVIALFMLLGFINSGAQLADPGTLAALGLVVGLPGVGAILLVRSHFTERDRIAGRKAELRQETLDSEVLRVAGERGARLTAIELSTVLGLSPEVAKRALDSLVVRGQADLAVSDEGILVYTFHDVRHIGGKESAKGVLE